MARRQLVELVRVSERFDHVDSDAVKEWSLSFNIGKALHLVASNGLERRECLSMGFEPLVTIGGLHDLLGALRLVDAGFFSRFSSVLDRRGHDLERRRLRLRA